MAKKGRISDRDALDIVIERLAGTTVEALAKTYGVSKQAIQYHESKDEVRELRSIILKRAAEVMGDAIGQMALEKFQSRIGKDSEASDLGENEK